MQLLTVRILCLMFVRLTGWMALLARSSASKDGRAAGAVPGARDEGDHRCPRVVALGLLVPPALARPPDAVVGDLVT